MLIDRFGRPITYLRISLTPSCNLRCVYCIPPEGLPPPADGSLLTNREIVSIVRIAAENGVKKVRLTGGEPLLRKGLVDLVNNLAALPGLEEITMTTNGILLARIAHELAKAGLSRVNISLDTLDQEKFWRITRGGKIGRVWDGIQAAEAAGLAPLKLNSVVIRGVNDDELLPLARLTVRHNWHVRFIELMPLGNQGDWGAGFPLPAPRYISVQDMHKKLASLNLQPVPSPAGNGPARTFRIPGAPGTVGFISPLGEHFCESCNRLRLTSDGWLRPCLLQDTEISVRDGLSGKESMLHTLQRAVRSKPKSHQVLAGYVPEYRRMAQIGG